MSGRPRIVISDSSDSTVEDSTVEGSTVEDSTVEDSTVEDSSSSGVEYLSRQREQEYRGSHTFIPIDDLALLHEDLPNQEGEIPPPDPSPEIIGIHYSPPQFPPQLPQFPPQLPQLPQLPPGRRPHAPRFFPPGPEIVQIHRHVIDVDDDDDDDDDVILVDPFGDLRPPPLPPNRRRQ
jgi:hypothetical protein